MGSDPGLSKSIDKGNVTFERMIINVSGGNDDMLLEKGRCKGRGSGGGS